MRIPAHLLATIRAHTGKRALAAAVAAVLLAGGFGAYSAASAPGAHAATEVTGGLIVSINPGSTTVGVRTVSLTVTYTCTDASAPGGHAQLRADFDQHGNTASGELSVACGTADVNRTQTVTAVQAGMSGSQEITATATVDDGTSVATADADTITSPFTDHNDPTLGFPGNGTVTATGSYNCGPGFPAPAALIITASQDNSTTNVAAGSAEVPITTCNGTNQPWSVTIASSLPGGTFIHADPNVTIASTPTTTTVGLFDAGTGTSVTYLT